MAGNVTSTSNSSSECLTEWPESRVCSGQGSCVLSSLSKTPQCECTSPWSGRGDFYDLELYDCGCHQLLLKISWAVAMAAACIAVLNAVYRIRAGMLLRSSGSAKVDPEPSTRTSSAESSATSSSASPASQRQTRRRNTTTRYKTIWGGYGVLSISYSSIHILSYSLLAQPIPTATSMSRRSLSALPTQFWPLCTSSWTCLLAEKTSSLLCSGSLPRLVGTGS